MALNNNGNITTNSTSDLRQSIEEALGVFGQQDNPINELLSSINEKLGNITQNSTGSQNAGNGSNFGGVVSKKDIEESITAGTSGILSAFRTGNRHLSQIEGHLRQLLGFVSGGTINMPQSMTDQFSDMRSVLSGLNSTLTSLQGANNSLQNNNRGSEKDALKAEIKEQINELYRISRDPNLTDKEKKEKTESVTEEISRLKKAEKQRDRQIRIAELAAKENIDYHTAERRVKEEERRENRKSRSGQGWVRGITGAAGLATSVVKGGLTTSGTLDKGLGLISNLGAGGAIAGAILGILKAGLDQYNQTQKFGSQYARMYGGARDTMDQYIGNSTRFIRNAPPESGFTREEYFNFLTGYTEAVGRQGLHVNDRDAQQGIAMQRMGIGTDVLNMMDTFGVGINGTQNYFNKLYGEAGKKGLSFRKLSETVKNNFKLAQSYTFSKGLEGLNKMAETSVRLKYNMTEVSRVAEKVSTLEGAIQAGANLSVLGGEFAQFSNPMALMYEGLNDMEGLNDRLINMFGNMAYFDKSKGTMDVSAFDRQRIRAAANAMGVDYNEMITLSMNKARENRVENQVTGRLRNKGINLNEEQLGYVRNVAQLDERGNAFVDINGEKRYDFENIIGQLKEESQKKDNSENMTIGDVWNNTKTVYDTFDQYLRSITEKLAALVAHFLRPRSAENEGYFRNNREELIKKYGSKKAAKAAIYAGLEKEGMDKYYGDGDAELAKKNIDWMNSKDAKKGEFWKNGNIFESSAKYRSRAAHNRIGSNDNNEEMTAFDKLRIKSAAQKLGISEDEVRYRMKNQSNSIASTYSRNYNVTNTTQNTLKPMSVTPTNGGYSVGAQKVSFEPVTVNLKGDIQLALNGNGKKISIEDINTAELKKEFEKFFNNNIGNIMKSVAMQVETGYSKEKDRLVGSSTRINWTGA